MHKSRNHSFSSISGPENRSENIYRGKLASAQLLEANQRTNELMMRNEELESQLEECRGKLDVEKQRYATEKAQKGAEIERALALDESIHGAVALVALV